MAGASSFPGWISLRENAPVSGEEILVWSAGRCVVAVMLTGEDTSGAWRDFMDAGSDRLLEPPSHWMPLPLPPA